MQSRVIGESVGDLDKDLRGLIYTEFEDYNYIMYLKNPLSRSQLINISVALADKARPLIPDLVKDLYAANIVNCDVPVCYYTHTPRGDKAMVQITFPSDDRSFESPFSYDVEITIPPPD